MASVATMLVRERAKHVRRRKKAAEPMERAATLHTTQTLTANAPMGNAAVLEAANTTTESFARQRRNVCPATVSMDIAVALLVPTIAQRVLRPRRAARMARAGT